ncbi:MAG TPA: bifunctional serine/threonine-protein kinase/ABC transporter substrate-binding protein [Dictyobacter sp.]|nr:bifunctional serine/threonine-protein kinase/ABC transporter substrate-binding protein [Dictyobacter sp.]
MIGSPSTPTSVSSSGITGSTYRSLAPGARLQGGRYLVKEILGQGGMGAALLATDNRLDGKLVVIKELISDSSDQSQRLEEVRNFKREVATLAHIDHPLVPNVTDHFQEGTRYFMVQEYVDGENLEARLDRTNAPLSEREALICTSEILDILEYLALQTPPIVHRDIKPANIIVSFKDKRAHLVDFGIARADEAKNAQRKQTAALGTPGYAPPEQYQGNADPRSDLYALAATLHHLLTGRDPRNFPPFQYPAVRTLNLQLSEDVESILNRALFTDINQRYQRATEMKHDIDAVLRSRFGISGNIDSYTMSTSMATPTVQTSGQQWQSGAQTVTAQTAANPQTPLTPVQPLSASPLGVGLPSSPAYPYTPMMNSQGQKRTRRNPLWSGLVVVLVIVLIAAGSLVWFTSQQKQASHGIGVTMVNNEPIGISDGSYAFDTTLADGQFKTEAAQQLQKNKDNSNTNAAISLLNQAIAKNTNDAEALIYREDLLVEASGQPYVTLVVATMLSGSSLSVGRDDLQGTYVAQKEYNDGAKLHGGYLVRVLIANAGSQPSNVQQVMKQLVQLKESDPTFVGVMGLPFSSYTQVALQTLKQAQIPLVSQTSSADNLSGDSYFFRVVPSNHIQGQEGAIYAQQVLHAKHIAVFADPMNSYSQTLAKDFENAFIGNGGTVVADEQYTVNKPFTLPSALQDALSKHPDMIYFAGYASDVSTLLADLPAGTMPVMGGDALYELGGYQSSSRANFGRLHFTTFAYPDEWSVLGYGSQQPMFFSEYAAAFAPPTMKSGIYGFTRADNDAILSYDATIALLTGCNNALSTGNQKITPQEVQQGLKEINATHAIQGVSGQIGFDQNGDPVNKTIVVLSVDATGHIHMEPTKLGRFLV